MPSVQDFKSSMQLNSIKDDEVTTEDTNLAEKVCSLNARSLKGKPMQLKIVPVAGSIPEILDESISIDLE